MIVEIVPEKLQFLHVAINEVINALAKKTSISPVVL